jgi:hypothetical protein
MTKWTRTIALLSAVALIALVAWIARHTHWEDVKSPAPLKGEALVNPFYAAQRFAGALGARTSWDRALAIPPADAVIVLGAWHWTLGTNRRDALEHWVESGGRLVVDSTLTGGEDVFERWSGVVREEREDDKRPAARAMNADPCGLFREERHGSPKSSGVAADRLICDSDTSSFLRSTRAPDWAMRGRSGVQAMRVGVGRGSVTVINASPFQAQRLFDGEHGWLFVAATALHSGDEVHFLSEGDHPSLLALIWRRGGPVVVLLLAVVGLLLWRGGVRFGPLAAPLSTVRRSLAEQIRGTGRFALQHGGGEALLAAVIRALDEAALRRIANYAGLSTAERASALARLTGLDRRALGTALHQAGSRRLHELPTTIALLEAARRHTLNEHTRSRHGRS